ncbi:MAG: CAP domain-containing protein [Burkholderiaceae bacterium]|nr:CAP domain-containing protein [Burkholderiaceae bacterium]
MEKILKIKGGAPMMASVLVVAMLSGCGGGGGGGSTTAATTPVPTPVVVTSNLVSSAPTPTYTAASEELLAFNLLNAERSRCGFGVLAQNTALDTAARGHADWLLINNSTGHFQIAGTTGFTGLTPDARLVAAGYGITGSFQSNAEAESDAFFPKAGTGVGATRGLLNAPYHMLEMIRGYRDVGVSVRDKSDVAISPNNRFDINMDFAYKNSDGAQVAAAGSVRTYPCDGSTGIVSALRGESPNPVPGRNLSTSPLGSSIGVAVDVGNTLVITSASMIKASTGAAITLRTPVVAANDPNAIAGVSYFKNSEGFVSADAPLEASTQYQVTINGTSSGVVFSRTFMFTTGS